MERKQLISLKLKESLDQILTNNRLIVYHGTKKEIDHFDYQFIKETGLFGYGFYFSQSIKVAKEEGGNIIYKCLIFDKKSNVLDFRTNANPSKKIFNLINQGLSNINKPTLKEYYINYSTSQIYYSFLKPLFNSEKDLTSFLLNECNIKGIKNYNQYKSLNYTVFDNKDIQIIERVI